MAATASREQISTTDGMRSYLIARPHRPGSVPPPLVIVLHGHGGSADQALGQNGRPSPLSVWLQLVDREGIVVIAPDGSDSGDGKRGWNDCRERAPGNPATDDVGFVRQLIERAIRDERIDASRVYVMGMSNGAMMSFRLALELDPPLAAIAAVSGSQAPAGVCGPAKHPVSTLIIAGTDDPLVPYAGGDVHFYRSRRGTVMGIEQTIDFWRAADGISSAPVSRTFAHREGDADPTRATALSYGGGAGKPQVELIRIDGGGHVEPSLSQHYGRLYGRIVGKQNRDLESVEEAWRFFRDKQAATSNRR